MSKDTHRLSLVSWKFVFVLSRRTFLWATICRATRLGFLQFLNSACARSNYHEHVITTSMMRCLRREIVSFWQSSKSAEQNLLAACELSPRHWNRVLSVSNWASVLDAQSDPESTLFGPIGLEICPSMSHGMRNSKFVFLDEFWLVLHASPSR